MTVGCTQILAWECVGLMKHDGNNDYYDHELIIMMRQGFR